MHEGELFPLHHHGKVDAVLFALVLLFGEDDVERGIAAADGALVFFDGGGDLGKRLLPVAAARAHLGEVVLQVVRLHVDEVDAVAGDLVLAAFLPQKVFEAVVFRLLVFIRQKAVQHAQAEDTARHQRQAGDPHAV